MTKSNCIITCEFDMTEYARLFTYEALTEDTCAVTGYVGTETASLLIPSADPEGRTVVAIGDRAFAGCSSLLIDLCKNYGTCLQGAGPVGLNGLAIGNAAHGMLHVGSPVDAGGNNEGVGAGIGSRAIDR